MTRRKTDRQDTIQHVLPVQLLKVTVGLFAGRERGKVNEQGRSSRKHGELREKSKVRLVVSGREASGVVQKAHKRPFVEDGFPQNDPAVGLLDCQCLLLVGLIKVLKLAGEEISLEHPTRLVSVRVRECKVLLHIQADL